MFTHDSSLSFLGVPLRFSFALLIIEILGATVQIRCLWRFTQLR